MASDDSEDLRAFLLDHVSSFEELEALLLLMRVAPGQRTVSEVAAALGLTEEMAQTALDGLLAASPVLERTAGAGQQAAYRYSRANEHAELLLRLKRTYDEQRLTVVAIMSSNALERLRGAAARRLADAFRLNNSKK